MVKRKGFVIYFTKKFKIKEIENLVHITYISKKGKYLVAYCDEKRFAGYVKQIEKAPGVISVVESQMDMDEYVFEENVSVK